MCLRTWQLQRSRYEGGPVSIRRTDLCAFEHSWFSTRRARRQRFNPSNGFVCLRTALLLQPGARRGVSIRRTDLCAFELEAMLERRVAHIEVSIRRTDLCAFELLSAEYLNTSAEVSIRRTDLCAFERRKHAPQWRRAKRRVSIRRTDLCAFEPTSFILMSFILAEFQSVERGMR